MTNNPQERQNVLVVDDDVNVRKALQSYLRVLQHNPVIASGGTEALQRLAENDILAALVDLNMPDLDGLQVVHAIREYDPTIQCIILTGFGSMETAIGALREQVYDYITKPVNLNDLTRILNRALEHTQALRHKQRADAMLVRRSEELAESLDALREAQARLIRTANAALLGQLAEGLRHELGNALTVIRLNVSLLAHYRENPERFGQQIESMEQGIKAIERIAVALRSIPATQNEQGELFDLAEVIRQAIQEAQQACQNQAGIFNLNLEETALVRGNVFRLIQAFKGIIENATEANWNSTLTTPATTITLRADQDRWRVTVRDNGTGLTPAALQHGAEPGFTTKVDRGFMQGLGLGLFVASNVVDQHGGQLQLSNAPDGGAVVEVWLPRADLVAG